MRGAPVSGPRISHLRAFSMPERANASIGARPLVVRHRSGLPTGRVPPYVPASPRRTRTVLLSLARPAHWQARAPRGSARVQFRVLPFSVITTFAVAVPS